MSESVCVFCQTPLAPTLGSCPRCGQPQILRERYRIQRLLGQGGFGVVYEAVDGELNRHYAIKLITTTSAAIREQVAVEAQILAQHARRLPFMPEIYDIWTEGNQIALVMEYIDGATIGSLIEQHGAWPPQAVGRFLHTVLSNLDTLHNVGIIHRDIKPDNIKRTADGRYVLLDFGIAKRSQSTETGAKAYSLYYASPEQALGKATDARSDLYSLAATAYHMLTGHPPAPGQARQVMSAELLPPAHFYPKTPPTLGNLVMQMLEIEPARRPQSAKAALQALVAPATGRSDPASGARLPAPEANHVRVEPVSSAGMVTQAVTPIALKAAPPRRAAPRSRGWTWLLAGLIVLLLGGGAFWIAQRGATRGAGPTLGAAGDRPAPTVTAMGAAGLLATDRAAPATLAPTPTPTSPAASEPTATAPSSAPTAIAPLPAPEPPALPTEVVPPTAVPLSAEGQQVVDLINDQRELQGLPRLVVHQRLAAAAQAHSADMAANDFFSDTGSDGSDPKTRINREGYIASLWIQNISAGYATPLEVVASLMDNDAQRSNLLNPHARDVGVGYAANPGSQYGHYWTVVYAKP